MKAKIIAIFLIVLIFSLAPAHALFSKKCSTSTWAAHYNDMKVTKMDGDGNMEIYFNHAARQEQQEQCKRSFGLLEFIVLAVATWYIGGQLGWFGGGGGTTVTTGAGGSSGSSSVAAA